MPHPKTQHKKYPQQAPELKQVQNKQKNTFLTSQGKRVAILANQTSIIGNTHLVDSLKKLGVNIVKVFGPEHGFRGKASAGDHVADEVDAATGIPIISLYGAKNKPSKADLANVDILLYDLQDVGVRFYTNINALARLMEACYENGKELLILDRPNPNGYLIDGPVLDMKYKSGIGMFPIPMSHGLTVGEFAQMANGEGWLANKVKCNIKIISGCKLQSRYALYPSGKSFAQPQYTTGCFALSIYLYV